MPNDVVVEGDEDSSKRSEPSELEDWNQKESNAKTNTSKDLRKSVDTNFKK